MKDKEFKELKTRLNDSEKTVRSGEDKEKQISIPASKLSETQYFLENIENKMSENL